MTPTFITYLPMLGVCGVSAVGGALLKSAADTANLVLLVGSLAFYSLSSLLLFFLYRTGAESFAVTTFTALLGTLIFTQILSSLVLHEPVNWRAFAVLLTAGAAFAWAVHVPAPSSHLPQATSHGGSHETN